MTRIIDHWNSFWLQQGPPHSLAIFRIFFGVFWLTRFIWWGPNVPILFSGDGMHFPAFPPPEHGIDSFESLVGWITSAPSLGTAWFLYSVGLLLSLFIILGLFTRLSLFLFFLIVNYYYYLYLHLHGTSYDRVLLITIFLLFLSPCGKAVSLDSYRKGAGQLTAVLWTQRMICVQVAIVYFATGVHKLTSAAWKNGDNLASSLYGDYATPLGFWVARQHLSMGFYDLSTILIILFELSAGFLLFSKKWRKWCFIFAFLFHAVNSSFLWIPEFLVVPISYILFIEPEAVKNVYTAWFDPGVPAAEARVS